MKSLTPIQSLLLLILISVAIGGWFYGIHWKRVASGDLFTVDEKMTIRLQEQIEALSDENTELRARINNLTGESDRTAITPPEPGPLLPGRPQKVETH